MNENKDFQSFSELSMLADRLEDIAAKIRSLPSSKTSCDTTALSAPQRAKLHYRGRRQRDRLFGNPDLFGEPAWDMMVDLFCAADEGKSISVSSLCLASAVPMTTALRWITILENEGIILREADPNDARRFYLSLSDHARARMGLYFDQNF
jgi:hypothetical protein